jgi:hypothetical protein
LSRVVISILGEVKTILISTKRQGMSVEMSRKTLYATSEAPLRVRFFLACSAVAFSKALLWLAVVAFIAPVEAAPPSSGNTVTDRHPQRTVRFTIDELVNSRFPSRISDDIDLDPCKGGKSLQLCENNYRFSS